MEVVSKVASRPAINFVARGIKVPDVGKLTRPVSSSEKAAD